VGILEWIGAHFLGPLVSLYRTIHNKPRPELKIHDLRPTGGGPDAVNFHAVVQNVGTKSARCTVTARVGETEVPVVTPTVELLPNAPSQTVQIHVPRPGLGELVKQFNSDTTLYGRTLVVVLADEKRHEKACWREHVYTPEENSVRADIQQREWRIGRDEATDDDMLADQKAGNTRTMKPRFPLGS
jgi:hypothetical protein